VPLRPRAKWRCSHRGAAEKRDELTPPHFPTPSSRSRRNYSTVLGENQEVPPRCGEPTFRAIKRSL
jgi:hypothetical protein